MDSNEAFIEGELFEEINVDDNAGPSHHIEGGHQGATKRPAVYIKKDEQEDEDDNEYEEEQIQGQIIQGEDGEYYVLMDDDGVENVEIDDNPDSVELVVTADGEHQLVFKSIPTDPNGSRRIRPARAIVQETDAGQVEMIQFTDIPEEEDGGAQIDLALGAIQTAEANDDHMMHDGMGDPLPLGLKLRRSRVYGSCRCSECGQSFVNTARLERHLAVHQVFGSFLCPLCGKTYKYEYNLFYHWRRTCRDLNELMSYDDRKTMDVNSLRSLVDEVAAKKQEYGPIEIGISRSVLYQTGPLARLEMPTNPLGRRGTTCRACGVVVHMVHLPQHLNLHKGVPGVEPDSRSLVGGHYCDLCGLLFRQQFNLIKHWRTNCAEIQGNLPENIDLTLDDAQLKEMVRELLKRASTNEAILEAETQRVKMSDRARRERAAVEDYVVPEDALTESRRDRDEGRDGDDGDEIFEGREIRDAARDYADEPGAVFADDFEDDEVHMLGEEAIGAGGTIANRAKWHMGGGPVQCQECFRSFANAGRLERHMAGFHSSHGTHHCALCGNRFKYDYNLLYHYRKSCPYTKQMIERDVRDQMDAGNLRKLVRQLALKEPRLQPVINPMRRLPKMPTHQTNDAAIRREMIRPILASAPAVLTQARRGMANLAKQCPICNIIFYQDSAIQRHMSMRHGMEYNLEDFQEEEDMQQCEQEQAPMQRRPDIKTAKKAAAAAAAAAAASTREQEREALDEDEAPPTLEVQQPGEQAALPKDPRARFGSHTMQLRTPQPHIRDVQEMYERGELRDGDRIIIQEDGREVEYTVNHDAFDEMEVVERVREEDVEEAYDEEPKMVRVEQQMMPRVGGSRQLQQQQQMRRFPGGRDAHASVRRLSTSSAIARKRPREEEASMWDDDLLEDDEEMEQLQREVDRRRANDASAAHRRQPPAIMHRRGHQ